MARIEAENVTQTYGRGDLEVHALRGVSLSVQPGEVVGLLGPSGSGKSTLLRCLGLLDPPRTGVVRIDGAVVATDGRILGDAAALRRRRIGFVFQRANLVPFLDVRENVLLPLRLDGGPDRAGLARADALLRRLDLWDRRAHSPSALSGGQAQRVALARALVASPALVLADEPTAALDAARGREAILAVREVARDAGAAVIVVTHDTRILDAFDRTLEMEDGRLLDAPTERPRHLGAAPSATSPHADISVSPT